MTRKDWNTLLTGVAIGVAGISLLVLAFGPCGSAW